MHEASGAKAHVNNDLAEAYITNADCNVVNKVTGVESAMAIIITSVGEISWAGTLAKNIDVNRAATDNVKSHRPVFSEETS